MKLRHFAFIHFALWLSSSVCSAMNIDNQIIEIRSIEIIHKNKIRLMDSDLQPGAVEKILLLFKENQFRRILIDANGAIVKTEAIRVAKYNIAFYKNKAIAWFPEYKEKYIANYTLKRDSLLFIGKELVGSIIQLSPKQIQLLRIKENQSEYRRVEMIFDVLNVNCLNYIKPVYHYKQVPEINFNLPRIVFFK